MATAMAAVGAAIRSSVYGVQLALLDGVYSPQKLASARDILTRSEYHDVVTERSIANLCGFPLCRNPLVSDRTPSSSPLPPPPPPPHHHRKGRYKISLREHKVYDLQETRLFCCSDCLVSSQVFASSLAEEREHDKKIVELAAAFHSISSEEIYAVVGDEDGGKDSKLCLADDRVVASSSASMHIGSGRKNDSLVKDDDMRSLTKEVGEDGADGIGKGKGQPSVNGADRHVSEKQGDPGMLLLIHEQNQVTFQDFSTVGPSDAIEGYVPQKDYGKGSQDKSKGVRKHGKSSHVKVFDSDPKKLSHSSGQRDKQIGSLLSSKGDEVAFDSDKRLCGNSISKHIFDQVNFENDFFTSDIIFDEGRVPVAAATRSFRTSPKHEEISDLATDFTSCILVDSDNARLASKHQKSRGRVSWADHNNKELVEEFPSSSNSSKSIVIEKQTMSIQQDVPPAVSSIKNDMLHREVPESRDTSIFFENQEYSFEEENDKLESARALVSALTQAAEAVAMGELDSEEAVARAGIIVKPSEEEIIEIAMNDLKRSSKADIAEIEDADAKSCWYSAPPKGFKPEVSTFGMMWMALDEWISCASIAHIYGSGNEDDFSFINGKEYVRQVVIGNGVSAEIERTLGGCISRALPALAEAFRLPLAVSTLEQGLGRLLRTMSLVSSIPPFSSKQWRVVVILLLDALSVHRLPALRSCVLNSSLQFQKALDASSLTEEEYGVFRDLLLPLGRHPEFAAHCGA